MRHFIRTADGLHEVHVITKASRENPSVKVQLISSGQYRRVLATDVLTDY